MDYEDDWDDKQEEIGRYLDVIDSSAELQFHFEEAWRKKGGEELERALHSGAIALLDAQWIVNFVRRNENAILPCRQELPTEAFLCCDALIRSTSSNGIDDDEDEQEEDWFDNDRPKGEGIHIIVLSYMWLHPRHPDPKGTTLKLLARWCQKKLESSWMSMKVDMAGNKDILLPANYISCGNIPRWGVFWDFASLYQHPDPENGIQRTPQEDKLFRKGLHSLSNLFSHPQTHCFKVTQFPPGYPMGYDLPASANSAEYMKRGWPLVESSWISMVKSQDKTYDITVDDVRQRDGTKSRTAPLTPDKLREKLERASFTNAKDDQPLVLWLYSEQFDTRFSKTAEMCYAGLDWDDEQIKNLADLISQGHTPSLKYLDLSENTFGSEGCKALARALSGPRAPRQLREIHLKRCWIGDDGVRALAHVFVHGTSKVNLEGDPDHDSSKIPLLGNQACLGLAEEAETCINNGSQTQLRNLNLSWITTIGDEGVGVLANMIVHFLQEICLQCCGLGDDACRVLAEAAIHCPLNQLPLKILDLCDNRKMSNRGSLYLCHLLIRCPAIKTVNLSTKMADALTRECLEASLVNPPPEPGIVIHYWDLEEA